MPSSAAIGISADTNLFRDHRRLIGIIFLFILYVITARVGLSFYAVNGFATLVWPPAGISLAALLLAGSELWPGIILGAFFANVMQGASVFPALGIAIGNTLEALVGWWLLRRVAKFDNTFSTLKDSILFVLIGALFAPTVAATIGTLALSLSHTISHDIVPTWATWWFGDMLGVLVFTPLIITWSSWRRPMRSGGSASAAETFFLLAFVVCVNLFIFWTPYAILNGVPTIYALLIPLMWASFRFGPRGKSLAICITSVIAIWATANGSGPFAMQPTGFASLMALQIFITVIAIIFLTIASLNEERTTYRLELEKYVEKLEKALQKNREQLASKKSVEPLGGEGGESVSFE